LANDSGAYGRHERADRQKQQSEIGSLDRRAGEGGCQTPRSYSTPHYGTGIQGRRGGFVPLGERYWPLSISVKPSLVPLIPAMVPFGSYLELSSAIDTSALVLACFDPQ